MKKLTTVTNKYKNYLLKNYDALNLLIIEKITKELRGEKVANLKSDCVRPIFF